MTLTRQDAWSQDEDLLLAEVVLRYIRDGGTQLAAFEEVGRKLSRTSAACGFRWNSFVRKQYKSGIELAKKQRKQLKKQFNVDGERETYEYEQMDGNEAKLYDEWSFSKIITYLEKYQQKIDVYVKENHRLKERLNQMKEQNEKLLNEKIALEKNLHVIEEDYKALIEIMERARKMVVLQEDERNKKVKFQMDKNGNLERVEK